MLSAAWCQHPKDSRYNAWSALVIEAPSKKALLKANRDSAPTSKVHRTTGSVRCADTKTAQIQCAISAVRRAPVARPLPTTERKCGASLTSYRIVDSLFAFYVGRNQKRIYLDQPFWVRRGCVDRAERSIVPVRLAVWPDHRLLDFGYLQRPLRLAEWGQAVDAGGPLWR